MNRVLVALFTWLALSTAFMGLSNLIAAGGWQIHLVMLAAIVTALTWGITTLGRSHRVLAGGIAVVASTAVWACHLCLVAQGGPGGIASVFSPDAWDMVVTNLSKAVEALPEYSRPASEPWLFFPLGILGLGPVATLGAWLALGLRRPQWVGVPLLVCWVIFLTGRPSMGMGWAVATGAAYLILLALSPWKGRQATGLRLSAALVVVPCVIVGLVGSAIVGALPGWGSARGLVSFWVGTYSDMTGIDADGPILVGDSLRTRSNVIVFRTHGDYAGPVKMGTLYDFDGSTWHPAQSYDVDYPPGRTVGDVFYQWEWDRSGAPVNMDWLGPGEQWHPGPVMDVRIEQLSGEVLPTAVGPRSVSNLVPGADLTHDISQDSIAVSVPLEPGMEYTVDTMTIDHELLASMVRENDTSVTFLGRDADHSTQIALLAAQITQHTDNTYDAILTAIQDYLTGSDFRYTLTPTWRASSDPVWDFLENKEGYCVHYATAMAVLGSALGIQMRVSVGYLPGQADEDGWRTVRGANAHMWPEAYYPGIGWIGYEPTPSIGVGAAVMGQPTEQPSAAPSLDPEPTMNPTQSTGPDPVVPPPQPVNESGWGWAIPWLIGAGSLVGAAGLVGVIREIFVRRYRAERAFRRIFAAGEKAGLLHPGMSVRTTVAILGKRVRSQTADGLASLRDQVEEARYGPPESFQAKMTGRDLFRLKTDVERQLRT